ncbi:alanine aminotransferase 2 [Ochromonadaceae sp. CCMP2298]|nr:alanine aminotransferase 2 [Ochromonadaceae sp. CCMP2298]
MQSRLGIQTISNLVKNAQYAVRGPIVSRAAELEKQLHDPSVKLPFKSIISCNIGNPHSLEQQPLSFSRDVLSLVLNPSLKDRFQFPADVVRKADRYLSRIPGMGAYTESQGIITVREDVSRFLEERDGHPSNPADIFLTNGASDGVRIAMMTFLREAESGFKDAILAPIPQYPIYSALSTLLNGNLEPYFLDEANAWGCSAAALSSSLANARAKGLSVRGLVVINPGNPTGQVLGLAEMREIVAFCAREGVCLMADEVYQENIWKAGAKFISFRKVALEMGFTNEDKEGGLQMVSFHSTSKGFYGECGLRGGYFELFGIPAEVKAQLYKLSSIALCANTCGQVATGLMVQPPTPGDESYATYKAEKDGILASLHRRADLLSEALNRMEGVTCNTIDGALYAFPSIQLPPRAVDASAAQGVSADAFYCMQLLEQTGIVVVPGSGFGQAPNTLHFRLTILPPEDKISDVVTRLAAFHTEFLKQYA